ncbi:MAG TPA: phage tail sheath family protein [Bryobacteraceae bacterium]|nr:phage tail sheath family protein [Bryobacteraceae bacterium]
MPQYFTPGVYVEEIERGPRPIEGVPTSIAAFLGETERGPLRPRLLTSYSDYLRWFGGIFDPARYAPYAVSGFFDNGGIEMYMCRIVGNKATTASKAYGEYTVSATGPGAWGKNVWIRIQDGSTKDGSGHSGFCLKLAYWPASTRPAQAFDPFDDPRMLPRPQYMEVYDDLSIDPLSADFFRKRLVDTSTNRPLTTLGTIDTTLPGAIPANKPPLTANSGEFLDGNAVDDPNPLTDADYDGAMGQGRLELQGLQALNLDSFRDVSLIYAPHAHDNAVAIETKIKDYCELSKYRFAVIDCNRDDDPANLNPRVTNHWDSSYAAFYAPWIVISDPDTGVRTTVPPGGSVLGIYARTDTDRGVFKAPANEIVNDALDVKFEINDAVQGILNSGGVNVIRSFPTRGIRVWGARTLSSDTLWKYVSVRRLFIFLERSIYEGTQWVVFEPNDERLWARVKDTIRLFLRTQWRDGALMGITEDQAFFITCDRTTMTQDDIFSGRLICEIGIAPVRPAEFVIFRVFQQTAEPQH